MAAQRYFSHGKLLITGEYFVLDGAKALALPTKLGQELWTDQMDDQAALIYWKTFREGQLWLSAVFNYETGKILETTNSRASAFVLKLFKVLKTLGSFRLQEQHSYKLESNIEFPENYGLGSSSTLICNLATWANVDPFVLNDRGLGGSGYDIAVAKAGQAIFYTRTAGEKKIERLRFNPPFKNQLLFIHLNKKQDSREGINAFRKLTPNHSLIQRFTTLTENVAKCMDLNEFSDLMREHERLLASHLKMPVVHEKYFPEVPTFVKSLGAWGGDFVMSSKFDDYTNYFKRKGYPIVLSYDEIID